ncbi:hypothetical protein ACN38_g3861 [Penicillium nordicum]|uniref:F-box domain-containing protein n=1 Tax=Penicillium nordicum TaxID=229535 RepID=A0A0M8P7L5_9EURO|nr:hypothetical protein ACN38_g3861 [Penicillium nordicum]
MPASFLGLPAELRNEIYMDLLVRTEPIDPWSSDNRLAPNLLYTNMKILREARSLLYGDNCFDFSGSTPKLINQFLDEIGFANASHIRCIRIDFPGLRGLDKKPSLEVDGLDILEKIQCHCTNLNKFIMAPESTDTMERHFGSLDSPNICANALVLVDARFREISSLQDIVVEVYEKVSSSDMRKKMKSHGWKLNVAEEEDGFENDEYLCQYDSDYY